jgi:predicted RNA-binding protein with PUA-like domain
LSHPLKTCYYQKNWIFQVNPSVFRIFDWWKEHPDQDTTTWSVRQHSKEIFEGEKVMIWVSGKKGGIYALAEIISQVYDVHSEDGTGSIYWFKKSEMQKTKKMVKLRYIKKFFKNYIPRNVVKAEPALTELSIIKQPRGTNFAVTPNQWHELMKLVHNRS